MIEKIAVFCKNFIDWFKSDRCFVKYFIDAFEITNNNMIMLTMLLLFIFILSMYLMFAGNSPMSLIVVILITSALASGFFYSMKKSIQYMYNREDKEYDGTKNKTVSFGTFYSGVGKYYLHFFCMITLFFILSALVMCSTCIVGKYIICDIKELGMDLGNFFYILATDANSSDAILSGLSKTQQIHLRDWNRLFLLSTQLFTFLIMFWIPEKMYTKNNVIICLFSSIKKVILDLPNALCIFLTIALINYLISVFTMFFVRNQLVVYIMIIVSLYVLVYCLYAVFLYYKIKYVEEDER